MTTHWSRNETQKRFSFLSRIEKRRGFRAKKVEQKKGRSFNVKILWSCKRKFFEAVLSLFLKFCSHSFSGEKKFKSSLRARLFTTFLTYRQTEFFSSFKKKCFKPWFRWHATFRLGLAWFFFFPRKEAMILPKIILLFFPDA